MIKINKILLMLLSGLVLLSACDQKSAENDKKILYYTDGMHPSVHVSVEDYKKGDDSCPICYMPLVPVYADTLSGGTNTMEHELANDPKQQLEKAIQGHILGQTEMIGTYQRNR